MSTWRDIVFLHGDDYFTDDFNDMGIEERVDYMLQWDHGYGEISENSHAGTTDHVYTIVRGDTTYELNVNYSQGYAGLCEVVK